MKRQYFFKLMAIFSFVALISASNSLFSSVYAAHSYEPKVYKFKKDPDLGWLPNLTGLPDEKSVLELTQPLVDVVMNEKNDKCSAIDPNLRMLIFQHFVIQQQMANAQNIYFNNRIAQKWAHVLAMILKESSGDTASVTDMRGRSMSTYKTPVNLNQWKKIVDLANQTRIKLNYQTNYGLTQTSADRLFLAFQLAKNQNFNTEFLEGIEGTLTPTKVALNTAIAIRRLIWFYQDFAQGRTSQNEKRIHKKDINASPEYYDQYQKGLKMAVIYCGTRFMFNTPHYKGKKIHELRDAIASIAYCKLGNAKKGYGKGEYDEQCFAQWVTLCPALNIDIAILTPLSYFETRGEHPVCEKTFRQLIKSKE